jgi:hypothetical protein
LSEGYYALSGLILPEAFERVNRHYFIIDDIYRPWFLI